MALDVDARVARGADGVVADAETLAAEGAERRDRPDLLDESPRSQCRRYPAGDVKTGRCTGR
jgi:hypothetical protein